MYHGHRGRDIHPSREEARGASHPGGYPRHPEQNGPKGPGTPSEKTPIHAPCSARGGVAHLFHIQRALNQGGVDQAWLFPAFRCKLIDCKAFTLQAASRLTNLAEIVHREPTHLGFCDTSGLGAGGVWIDPARTGHNLVWQLHWPHDIVANLVSSTNPQGTITKLQMGGFPTDDFRQVRWPGHRL